MRGLPSVHNCRRNSGTGRRSPSCLVRRIHMIAGVGAASADVHANTADLAVQIRAPQHESGRGMTYGDTVGEQPKM